MTSFASLLQTCKPNRTPRIGPPGKLPRIFTRALRPICRAAKTNRANQMAVVKAAELIGQLSNPRKTPRAILIHGADRSDVYELCQRVVKKIIDAGDETLNVSRLTEAQLTGSPGRLFEEFSSISMFGGNRVIWVSAA